MAGLGTPSDRLQSICRPHPANQAEKIEFVLQQFAVLPDLQTFTNPACFTWQPVRQPAQYKDITNASSPITR
ncbi:hypothetical protein IQ270_04925 [Microcoleus sp. LEGE 07076]|uniref:hypothetical protein n=1 Tax=Microcoleus sp. LEGE 07076 TaxID=915322 RepID=UPI001881771A|nr:hypothetical protein [Microcoleus sp. LEGE 07076]MBE9184081.1 hypothetical protein [Microcoleus sp. LEGE 07076]